MRVTGRSMEPSIAEGDIILVERLATGPSINDILLWKTTSGRIIAHRVVFIFPGFSKKINRRFLMQGDACLRSDGWIVHDQVLGRVIARDVNGKLMPPTAISSWRRLIRLIPGVFFLYLQKFSR